MKQLHKTQALLALVAAAALLLTTAVVVLHSHEDLAGRMCQACKIAQLPVLGLEPGPVVHAPTPVAWTCSSALFVHPRDPLLTGEPSRAPPA